MGRPKWHLTTAPALGIIPHKQKALMGTRRGFPSLREPVVGANRCEMPRDTGPGAAGLNRE